MFIRNPSDLVTIEPDKDEYLPGDQGVIACPSGYRVNGSTERICRSDLTWSGESTTCTAKGIAWKRKSKDCLKYLKK